jgi:hypothetical protein
MAVGGDKAQALAMRPGKTKLLPMQSRRVRGLILLTFGEANDPQSASGMSLMFLVFDGGARPRLSFSGFKKQL